MPRKKPTLWDELRQLIVNYGEASRVDEMRGGGDPSEFEIKRLEYELAKKRVEAHITRMEREFS